jgi:hypothetical protein
MITQSMADQKRRSSEAKEWLYRLAKDPKQYEKEAFIDGIEEMKLLIEELEKIRKATPATDHFLHAEIAKDGNSNELVNVISYNIVSSYLSIRLAIIL